MAKSGLKIFAPASIGNVACGFDVLGLCLDKVGDELVATPSETAGIHISKIHGDNGKLPLASEHNTAGVAALAMLRYGIQEGLLPENFGLNIELFKKMPFGSGLGSSSASAVAGAMAVNQFFKHPLDKRDLLPFALEGEAMASGSRFADNVAPSLIGGIVLVRDHETADIHRLPVPRGLFVVVVHPHFELLTQKAREILNPNIPLSTVTQQTANLGGFIVGLYNSDFDLIGRSLKDIMIEPQRSVLIPGFDTVKDAALNNAALGCSISGAGPSVFAIFKNTNDAEQGGKAMQAAFKKAGLNSTIYHSPINREGAVLL